MDTIEIQADTVEEVAKYASDKLKCKVVKNDTGYLQLVECLKNKEDKK